MDFEKYIKGVMSAPPEKRYKTFLTTAADTESVYVLSNDEGFVMYGDETVECLLVWPKKEFITFAASEDDEPFEMDVHDFIEMCREEIGDDDVMVFPTDVDGYIVSGNSLAEDLEAFLAEVE